MVEFSILEDAASENKQLIFSEIVYVKDLYDWIENNGPKEGWVQFLFGDSDDEMASFAFGPSGDYTSSSIFLAYKYRQIRCIDFKDTDEMGRVYRVRLEPAASKGLGGLETSVCYSYTVSKSNVRIFATLIGKVAGRDCIDAIPISGEDEEEQMFSVVTWMTEAEHSMVALIMRLNGFEFEEEEPEE